MKNCNFAIPQENAFLCDVLDPCTGINLEDYKSKRDSKDQELIQ